MRLFHRLSIVRPAIRVGLAVAIAVTAGLVTLQATSAAAAARDRLGDLRPALVLTTDVAAGTALTDDQVTVVHLPASMLPDDTLEALGERSVLRVDGVAREVLVASRLAGGRGGPAALVPPGWRAVAVPSLDASLPVRPGDLVDVLATADPFFADVALETVVVAIDAVVVHATETDVTVAVPADQVPALADALAAGTVVLALSG